MYAVKTSDTVTDVGLQTFPERVVINKVMDPPRDVIRGRETFLNSLTVDCQTCDALNTNTNYICYCNVAHSTKKTTKPSAN
jgi:hypothetical protein